MAIIDLVNWSPRGNQAGSNADCWAKALQIDIVGKGFSLPSRFLFSPAAGSVCTYYKTFSPAAGSVCTYYKTFSPTAGSVWGFKIWAMPAGKSQRA
jgi:hypothetical protein